ncbi:MAG: hypothetical protein HOP15_17480 [Planctomycetes bacterium]|nr:hypothetical protein [Planctomycetota bacterium]
MLSHVALWIARMALSFSRHHPPLELFDARPARFRSGHGHRVRCRRDALAEPSLFDTVFVRAKDLVPEAAHPAKGHRALRDDTTHAFG